MMQTIHFIMFVYDKYMYKGTRFWIGSVAIFLNFFPSENVYYVYCIIFKQMDSSKINKRIYMLHAFSPLNVFVF